MATDNKGGTLVSPRQKKKQERHNKTVELKHEAKELLAELAMVEQEITRLEGEITVLQRDLNHEHEISEARKSQQWQQGSLNYIEPPVSTPQTQGINKKHASLSLGSEVRAMFFINQAIKGSYLLNSRLENEVKESSGAIVMKETPSGGGFQEKVSRKSGIIEKQSLARLPSKHTMSKPVEGETKSSCNSPERPLNSLVLQEEISKNYKPNKISESIMKCLMCIFVRLIRKSRAVELEKASNVSRSSLSCSSSRSLWAEGNLSFKAPGPFTRETDQQDPYGIFGMEDSLPRDIGPYKNFVKFTASSLDVASISNYVPLLRNLRVLLNKLCNVDLRFLSYQQKLAFWINMYNACMMHAFLQYGLPSTPDKALALMNKAVLNIGGNTLNALAIEHFILRQPSDLKDFYWKGEKEDNEAAVRSIYGLEYPEPNVTFALSCGSRSSPAVKIYTANDVSVELEKTKLEYLQASIGVTATKKLVIPKLLHWYMLDFARDMDSLVEWICNQLPTASSLRKSVMECLRCQSNGMVSKAVEVMPYDFEFQYLLAM